MPINCYSNNILGIKKNILTPKELKTKLIVYTIILAGSAGNVAVHMWLSRQVLFLHYIAFIAKMILERLEIQTSSLFVKI